MKINRRIATRQAVQVLSIMAFLACAPRLFAQSNIDITAQIRESAAAVVITGSASHASYMPTKAFDGSITESGRWLGTKPFPPANIDYHIPADWEPGKAIRVTSYIVRRLTYGSFYYVERMPTAFTLSGSNDGGLTWAELDSRSGVNWSAASSNVYAIASPVSYRSYRFTALASNAADTYPIGVGELIFLGDVAEASESLTIMAEPQGIGAPVPAYGITNGLTSGDTFACSAPSPALNDSGSIRYACTGSVLETLGASGWVNPVTNAGASRVYVHSAPTARLTWLWDEVGYRLDASMATGTESIQKSPAPDADGCYTAGTQVALTPVCAMNPASRFVRWTGDVPAGCETNVPLVVTVDRPLAISAEFARSWMHVATTNSTQEVITDGNWTLLVQPDTTTGTSGGYRFLTSGGSILSGAGSLDLSTLLADTTAQGFPVRLSYIGYNAFSGNAAITSVVMPDELVRVGESAFQGCSSLKHAAFPASLPEIIDTGIFADCSALETARLPDDLVSMAAATFRNCVNLKTVTPFFPPTLKTIASSFNGCSSLEGSPDWGNIESIGWQGFYNCAKVTGHANLTNLVALGDYAFRATGITSLSIPKLDAIPLHAFSYTPLTHAELSESLADIGGSAFGLCTSLSTIEPFLPGTVTNIGEYAFSQSGIAGELFAPNLQAIGQYAFRGCSGLSGSLNLPALVSMGTGGYQFDGVSATNVAIPALKVIPKCAFVRAKALWSVQLSDELVEIGAYAFRETALASIEPALPVTLQTVGYEAFAACTNLWRVGRIVFPASLTSLGASVFDGSVLAEVDLMATGLTAVPERAFRYCVFSSVYLPETITEILAAAFAGPGDLKRIYFCGAPPATVAANWAWSGSDSGLDWQIRLYVPHDQAMGWPAVVTTGDFSDKPNYETVSTERLMGAWNNKWVIRWSPPRSRLNTTIFILR